MTKSLAGQWKVPLTREFIGSHAEVDPLFTRHLVSPFFPWAMLMKDLNSEKEWVSIRPQRVPIATGYMERGRTHAAIREIAIGLGYRVHFDALENVSLNSNAINAIQEKQGVAETDAKGRKNMSEEKILKI